MSNNKNKYKKTSKKNLVKKNKKTRKSKTNKKYYTDIDIIRLLACVSILLYHLNILKGGYLAVCIFFVLSGYLSCISSFKKEKISLKDYYYNRLIKLYIPLLLVVFMTISAVNIFVNFNWLSLKPETTSILFGYNNFWQLSANLDYFARHINSPFMHLWYMGIILQFDLVFPFIYNALRKVEDKFGKFKVSITLSLLTLLSTLYFIKVILDNNIMAAYYSTFSRLFSLLFGLSLGFIHSYYGSLIPKKINNKNTNKIIFYSYILILLLLFIFVDSNSIYFFFSMILVTIISCRLIDYGTIVSKKKLSNFDKNIKIFTDMSYEIYLFQYPVIFLFQYLNIYNYLKIPIIIIITLLISYIIHFCINDKSKDIKKKSVRYTFITIILCLSLFGLYKYITAKDHTVEMKKLENQLAQNEKVIQKKQEEYAKKQKEEEENWLSTLQDLENAESKVKEVVVNSKIVGVGDSVMLGAVENLYDEFPNGYFDAKISRTAWVVNDILVELKNKNLLGDPVVLNLGANGDCSDECKEEIIKTCGDREIFWINTTNSDALNVNVSLSELAKKHDNLYIIDWYSISKGHTDYFYSDGIHLTGIGRKEYTKAIYNAIYKVYLDKYKEKWQDTINKHNEEINSGISFYGNDILLNAFDYIQSDFENAKYVIDKDFNYKNLKEEIEKSVKENSITRNVVLSFDSNANMDLLKYKELIELCSNQKVYIVSTNYNISDLDYENVVIINFYEELKSHDDYLMADGIHLTEKGNKALSKILKNTIK